MMKENKRLHRMSSNHSGDDYLHHTVFIRTVEMINPDKRLGTYNSRYQLEYVDVADYTFSTERQP
jgi:hypothetical protein